MSAPFPNEYKLRKVADAQLKSCVICYKPSPSVLISSNSVDFFYVCRSHLKDDNFAVHSPNEAYTKLINDKAELVKVLDEVNASIEKKRPSMLNKLPGIGNAEKNKEAQAQYDALVKERDVHEKNKTELETKIDQFEFKDYALDNGVYRMRVRNYVNKKANEKRVKEMSNPGFFPDAPTTKPA